MSRELIVSRPSWQLDDHFSIVSGLIIRMSAALFGLPQTDDNARNFRVCHLHAA